MITSLVITVFSEPRVCSRQSLRLSKVKDSPHFTAEDSQAHSRRHATRGGQAGFTRV